MALTNTLTTDIALNDEQLDTAIVALGEFIRQDACPHCVMLAKDLQGLLNVAREGLQEAIDEDIRVNGEK